MYYTSKEKYKCEDYIFTSPHTRSLHLSQELQSIYERGHVYQCCGTQPVDV